MFLFINGAPKKILITGCYVIGFAGSDDKVKWLTEELGFDKAYNYKTADWDASLKEAAPNGIDCYFDNVSQEIELKLWNLTMRFRLQVGGLLSSTIRNHMKDFGRISVCGAISTYNDKTGEATTAPCVEGTFIFKQLKMEGFLVHRWLDRWMEGLSQMAKWIQEVFTFYLLREFWINQVRLIREKSKSAKP